MTDSPIFYCVEVETYRPGAANTAPAGDALGTMPTGAASQLPSVTASSDVLRASDLGYRTRPADGPVTVYPPFLNSALSMDRKLNLDPAQPAAAVAWGSLSLANAQGRYNALSVASNADARAVRVYYGTKPFDEARGVYVDPPFSALSMLFVGVARSWTTSATEFSVAVRDASYYIERPAQTNQYTGAGGLGGGVDLKGLPIPKTRGACRSVTPVLVDAVNRIYQYTDRNGSVNAMYEGGATGITFQSNVADLYTGTTNAGQYRTCNTKGLFQLGSTPVRQITIDCFGDFTTPAAGSVTTIINLARWFLLDDLNLPPDLLDISSFLAADSIYPYAAGFFLGPTPVDGASVVGSIVGSIAAKLVPNRNGLLGVLVLRAIPDGTIDVGQVNQTNTVSVTPLALDPPLDPPPFRWQVAYAHCWTVQNSNLQGSITPAQTQFLAAPDRFSVASSTTVLSSYRRPSDPPQVMTYLANAADAQAVAQALIGLWGTRRRLYSCLLPVSEGIEADIGSVVTIYWPEVDDLGQGRIGQVVGEQFRAGDNQVTLTILV